MSDNINKRYAKSEQYGNDENQLGGSNFKFDQEEVENKLRDAGETAAEFLSEVRETVSENYSRAENAIKNYPFLSAAAAFIAGITIARLFGHRD